MYGDGWIFQGGKGALSGGGGANGEWIWEEIDPPDDEYTHECADPLLYLGMLWDEESDVDWYAFEILMERKTVPSLGRFSTYGDPAILDYDEDSTGNLETEEYTHLPVPATAYESGEITTVSAYTYTAGYSLELEFDGATYYSPYECSGVQQYAHDIVLATRGQTYLDGLSGDYEGSIRLWQYAYQRVVTEETAFPGVFIPGLGVGSGGVKKAHLETLPLLGLLNFFNIGVRRST